MAIGGRDILNSATDIDEHPSTEAIERMVDGQADLEERKHIVRHLMKGCERCMKVAAFLHELADRRTLPSPRHWRQAATIDEALDRASEIFVPREVERQRREAVSAEAMLARLLALPIDDRHAWVTRSVKCHTPAFVRALLLEAVEAGRRENGLRWTLVDLAQTAAERIPPEKYREVELASLREEVEIAKALALRRTGDLHEALYLAVRLVARPPQDASNHGEALSALATVLADLGHFEQAAAFLDHARAIFRLLRNPHLEGRVLISQACALCWIEPETAHQRAEEGIRLLDAAANPRLVLCGRDAQIVSLVNLDKGQEAAEMLRRYRSLYGQFTDAHTRLHRAWRKGMVLSACGFHREAAGVFRVLASELKARHQEQEELLVTLDLARALLGSSETGTASNPGAEAVAILKDVAVRCQALGLHRDVMVALLVLAEEAEKGLAAVATFAAASEALRRRWRWGPEHESEAN